MASVEGKTNVSGGQKFPKETMAILERLYSKGLTGWGKDHAANIAITTGSTGLTLSHVKVITMCALINVYCSLCIPTLESKLNVLRKMHCSMWAMWVGGAWQYLHAM